MTTRALAGRRAAEAVVVLAAAAVVAIVVTWPLVLHLNHAAEDPADPRFQAWTIDWVQHAIAHPSRLFNADIFLPEKGTLAYSDSFIGLALPLLPLRWLGLTPIGQFNLALLAGFTVTAAAGYAFGKVVTGSVTTGAMVAAAFAFGEFGALESPHLQTVFRPGVALAATAAWLLADRAQPGAEQGAHPGAVRGRPRWPPATAMAASIAWQYSVSFYTGTYALAAAVVILAVRGRSLGRRGIVAAVAALVLAGGAALLLALPYLSRHAALPGFRWTLRDLGPEGADFLHADSRLLVWGGVLGRGRPWPEFPPPTFPGLALLGLGTVGALSGWRRGGRDRRAVLAGLALLVVGAVAAIGTSDAGWRRYAPYRLVYALVPGGTALRATFRAWMIGLLGLGLLAGIGAGWLARVTARRARSGAAAGLVGALVVAVAVFGVLTEGYRHWTHLAPVGTRPVDAELARLPGGGGVLYLPVDAGGRLAYVSLLEEADVVYRSTVHHRPMPNGYSGFFPDSYTRMKAVVRSLPGQPGLGYLQSIGVRYVVVAPVSPDSPWAGLRSPATAAPLRFIGGYGGDLLYELPSSAPGSP